MEHVHVGDVCGRILYARPGTEGGALGDIAELDDEDEPCRYYTSLLVPSLGGARQESCGVWSVWVGAEYEGAWA